MDNYIVSARKYRPMTFDSVVGQQALTTTLKNAISSGKLAHAYLFCGPRGVGKTTCARIFAKAINCLNPQAGGDACGECESCRAFNEQRSMNIHELDAASNNSVDDIREIITQVQIPPQTGRYKVFIIDEVHMLSTTAFNAFLKTLEEPPHYAIFILATTERHKILPTILSRCQVYDFARMNNADIAAHLQMVAQKEGYTAEPEALNLIAQKADGGMRDALSIFDQMVSFTSGQITYEAVCQNLNELSAEHYFDMTSHILQRNVQQCMLLLNTILQKGFDAGTFIAGMASHMRDLMMARDAKTIGMVEKSQHMQQRYAQQAMQCTPRFLYQAIKLCNDCAQAYRTSRNKRLQVEICLIQVEQLAEPDAPAPGPGPERTIKPLFQAAAPTAAAAPQATTQAAPQAAATTPAPTTSAPTTAKPVHTPSAAVANMLGGEAPRAQARRVTGYGPSLKRATPTMAAEAEAPDYQKPTEHNPLQADELRVAWYEIIQALPREHQAIAQRMRDMHPAILDADTLQVEVNNEQVAQALNEISPRILATLKSRLHNDFVKITITVQQAMQSMKRYSKPEMLQDMMAHNPALKDLVAALDLVLE